VEVIGRTANDLKDKAEPYGKMVMEVLDNICFKPLSIGFGF